ATERRDPIAPRPRSTGTGWPTPTPCAATSARGGPLRCCPRSGRRRTVPAAIEPLLVPPPGRAPPPSASLSAASRRPGRDPEGREHALCRPLSGGPPHQAPPEGHRVLGGR